MRVHVKVARSPKEIDGVFKVRNKVLVGDVTNEKKHFDYFDTIPTTINIIAVVDDTVVGCLRVTEESEVGLPIRQGLHLYPQIQDGKVASLTQFHLLPYYANNNQLRKMLISMGCYWCISRDITHVMVEGKESIVSLLQEIGFKGSESTPTMVLSIKDLKDSTLQYVQRMHLERFIDIFEREFYNEGDTIIQSGETGDTAYVVVEGWVEVSVPRKDSTSTPVQILRRGEMFGELALLTVRPRTADVIAATNVDLMVLNKKVFQEEVLGSPIHVRSVLEMLSNRLADTLDLLTKK